MKKTLLVAALVAGFAGMASASTVTLSGELKAEAKASVGYAEKALTLTVAPSWEAEFALAGSEDLSNGLKAIFEISAEVAERDFAFLNDGIKSNNEGRAKLIAKYTDAIEKYDEKKAEIDAQKTAAYEAVKDESDPGTKSAAETAADEAHKKAMKELDDAKEAAKTGLPLAQAMKVYEPVGGYGLNVKTAYVGLSGEMGTITFGLQEDEIYTKDKLFSDALHVANPLVKYVGEFGGAKVALNLADFHAVVAGGVVKAGSTDGVGLSATGSFAPVSLSAQYSMYGVTGGLTLATSTGFDHVGAALQLAYTYDKMLTVAAGYGYEFDVKEAVEVRHKDIAEDKLTQTQKDEKLADMNTNASRHHHRAFVGVTGKYAIDDMSELKASAEFQYSYNVARTLEHSFGGKLNVDYTYNMSKRTSVGVGLELVAPTIATTQAKDKSFDVVKGFSSELSVSLKHKF